MVVNGNMILADEGFALRPAGSDIVTTITSVSLADGDTSDNWEDCAYGETVERNREIMKYSVRSIIREMRSVNKYDEFRAFLEAARYDWEFIGSNYLADGDADFEIMKQRLVESGIVSKQELDTLLLKCEWSPE